VVCLFVPPVPRRFPRPFLPPSPDIEDPVDRRRSVGTPVGSGVSCTRVAEASEAEEQLRKDAADLVLLDLHIGLGRGEAGTEGGLRLLRGLRSRFPDIPVYLFSESPERRGLSAELLERVRCEGGARGILQKRFYGTGEEEAVARDAFLRQLAEIDLALRRQGLVEDFRRRAQTIDFDVEVDLSSAAESGLAVLGLRRVREVTAVSAADRNGPGGWTCRGTVSPTSRAPSTPRRACRKWCSG